MSLDTVPNALVTLLPEPADLGAFTVAGPARRFDHTSKAQIPQLWSQLISALPLPGQAPGYRSYGVVSNMDGRRGSFDYLAGVAIAVGSAAPMGFTVLRVAAGRYAVFRITLDGSAVHPQVKRAMGAIWTELIPAAGLRVGDGPDLEIYDERFAPETPGAQFDFYVSIES